MTNNQSGNTSIGDSTPNTPNANLSTSNVPKITAVTAICPKVLDALQAMETEAKARGIIIGLEDGLRDASRSDSLYALGRSIKNPDGFDPVNKPMGDIVTNAKGWQSLHNFGLAGDEVPKNSKGQFYWPGDNDPIWQQIGPIGEMFGLRWGGRWSIEKIDLDHFEMRPKGLSMAQLKDMLIKEGIDKIWSLV